MNQKNTYQTILVMIVGFLAIGLSFDKLLISWLALIIGILAIVSKQIAILIEKVWFFIAEKLGFINGTILLSLIFLLVLTPVALLRKLFTSKTATSDSFYVIREITYSPENLENKW